MSQWLVIRYRLVLENCSGLSDSFSNPESTNPEFNLRKWVLSFSFTVQRMIINKVTTFQKLEDSGFVMLSNELVKCLFFYFYLGALLMFCLLNPQTNACEPNPKTTSSDFNRWKSVTKIFCFHAISKDIWLLF